MLILRFLIMSMNTLDGVKNSAQILIDEHLRKAIKKRAVQIVQANPEVLKKNRKPSKIVDEEQKKELLD